MPFIESNRKRICYRDDNPSDSNAKTKDTFILVHGLGSSQNYYGGVVPLLVEAGYRCISLDTTGQGRSPYTGIEQSIDSLAEDIVGAMDALEISKAVVVGHSMAGLTVPALAAAHPDRVSAVVLLGPVYPSEAAAQTFAGRIDAVEKHGMEAMAATIPDAATGDRATLIHKAMIRELLLSRDPAGYISLCRVIADAWNNMPAYGKVKCPVLVIAGDQDKSAPVAGCEQIIEKLGSTQKTMTVMKRTGHWMAIEDSEQVAKLVLDFFQ